MFFIHNSITKRPDFVTLRGSFHVTFVVEKEKVKNVTHIALVITLLISLVGITISRHFCGKILAEVSIGTEAEPCCDGNEMPAGCECDSQTETLALDDDFQLEKQNLKLDGATLVVLSYFMHFLETDSFVESDTTSLLWAFNSPPAAEPDDIYIQVQSFLI